MPDTAVPTNGASTAHDLFALSDEQILEIEAEPQDIEIADVYLDDVDRAVLWASVHPDAGSTSPQAGLSRTGAAENRRPESLRSSGKAGATDPSDVGAQHAAPQLGITSTASRDGEGNSAESNIATNHQSQLTSHDLSAPPQWLADRMSDPQAGAEARALWDSVQQSKAEADGFREIFAKPEEARAAAQRARLLDDVDRAYFGGDTTQRASLAASMMREDPAAFREMVFAGLRALEQGAQATHAGGDASPPAHNATPDDTAGNSGVNNADADPQPGSRTSQAALARPHQAHSDSGAEHDTRVTDHIAANYAAFERSTNDDLERLVGSSIDRTLDRTLPHSNRADNAAMRTRLAASIRQDIERSLQGDRQLGEQVSQVLSARRLDEATRSQVVRLIGERAQQLVPGTTKRVLGEWTQTTLAAHRERGSRADAAIARRDVEPANPSQARPANTSASASTNAPSATRSAATTQRTSSSRGQKLDYRRVSDEQILDS